MRFEEAVEVILEAEGGYVNDQNDPGLETKYGISKRTFPEVDIKNLTREQAIEIYRTEYWNKVHADLLPPEIRLVVFDCAVNQGAPFGITTLQRVVGAKADGKIGSDTMQAIREYVDAKKLRAAFMLRRHLAYTRDPNWRYFGAGWSKRLLELALKA